MYSIGNIGNFETIPEPAAAIYEKNLKKMQELYERGWNINEKISLGKYSNITPPEILPLYSYFPRRRFRKVVFPLPFLPVNPSFQSVSI